MTVSLNATEESRLHRLFSTAAVLWIAGVTVLYVWIAVKAVRTPLNDGDDLRIVTAWLLLLSLITATRWVWNSPGGTWTWLGIFSVVALGQVLMSGQVVAALIFLLLGFAIWSSGDLVLRLLRSHTDQPTRNVILSLALGTGILSSVMIAVGVLGGVSPEIIRLLLILTSIPGFGRLRQIIRGWSRRDFSQAFRTRTSGILAPIMGTVFLFNLAWGLAPEIQFDALNYHLAVPKLYLSAGRIIDLPYFFHSYLTHLADITYLIGLGAGGVGAAKLLSVAWGLLASIAIFLLTQKLFGTCAGWWAAALFYTIPAVSFQAATTSVDIAVAFTLCAGMIPLTEWMQNRQNRSLLILSGLIIGFAVGMKLSATYILPVVLLFILQSFRAEGASLAIRNALLFGGIVVLAAAPSYAVIACFTGNPFYPNFANLFPAARQLPPSVDANMLFGKWGVPKSILNFVALPYTLTVRTNAFGAAVRGTLGILLLLALPFGVLRSRGSRKTVVFLSLIFFLLVWFSTFQTGRFLIPALPFAAIIAAAVIDNDGVSIRYRSLSRIIAAVALGAQCALIPGQFWMIRERIPWKVTTGVESESRFLAAAVPGYEVVTYLNGLLVPGEKVLGVATEPLRFYLNAHLLSAMESWDMQWLVGSKRNPDLAEQLWQHGIRYLLIDRSSTLKYQYVDSGFLNEWAEPVLERNRVAVYKLRRPPPGLVVRSRSAPVTGEIDVDPDPLPLCGKFHGKVMVRWEVSSGPATIRVNSPRGQLFVVGPAKGSASTGTWVTNGMSFYLLSGSIVLDSVTVRGVPSDCRDSPSVERKRSR